MGTEEEVVLRGVVRVEHLDDPEKYIDSILRLTNPHHLCKIYKINKFTDAESFLDQIAKKRGRLLKGGGSDTKSIAYSVIRDWQFGKIPHYAKPPEEEFEAAIKKLTDENPAKKRIDNAENSNQPPSENTEKITETTETVEENIDQPDKGIETDPIVVDLAPQTIEELEAQTYGQEVNSENASEVDAEAQAADAYLNPVELDIDLESDDDNDENNNFAQTIDNNISKQKILSNDKKIAQKPNDKNNCINKDKKPKKQQQKLTKKAKLEKQQQRSAELNHNFAHFIRRKDPLDRAADPTSFKKSKKNKKSKF